MPAPSRHCTSRAGQNGLLSERDAIVRIADFKFEIRIERMKMQIVITLAGVNSILLANTSVCSVLREHYGFARDASSH
jgi:hypothetical protein